VLGIHRGVTIMKVIPVEEEKARRIGRLIGKVL
jgi:hypothetical protein